VQAITQGRAGMMPAQNERLTPQQIKVLAAYVWGLSNRQAAQ
jgi:cytochrome c oxidase cbb3-type subunit III